MTVNPAALSKKIGADGPICKADRETDMEKTCADTKGRWDDVEVAEADVHILLCTKERTSKNLQRRHKELYAVLSADLNGRKSRRDGESV